MIDGIIDVRDTPSLDEGYVIEDAVDTGRAATFLPGLFAAVNAGLGVATEGGIELKRAARELNSVVLGARHGAVRNNQTFLVMANDDGMGRLTLEDDRVTVRWPDVGISRFSRP